VNIKIFVPKIPTCTNHDYKNSYLNNSANISTKHACSTFHAPAPPCTVRKTSSLYRVAHYQFKKNRIKDCQQD